MTVRSKQGAVRATTTGATQRVTWPGKRSAAQVSGKNPLVGPGKRSRTQGVPVPVAARRKKTA